jgi:hypothetical protein
MMMRPILFSPSPDSPTRSPIAEGARVAPAAAAWQLRAGLDRLAKNGAAIDFAGDGLFAVGAAWRNAASRMPGIGEDDDLGAMTAHDDAARFADEWLAIVATNPFGPAAAHRHATTLSAAEANLMAGHGPAAIEVGDSARPAELGPALVATASGRALRVAYEMTEIDTLVPAYTPALGDNIAFPAALRRIGDGPETRARQIESLATHLDPARLGPSADAATGAPIVGPDNVVESGSARVVALRRSYEQRGAAAEHYRRWLEAEGHDVAGLKAPILIARRISPLGPAERIAFVREANVREIAAEAPSMVMPARLMALGRAEGADGVPDAQTSLEAAAAAWSALRSGVMRGSIPPELDISADIDSLLRKTLARSEPKAGEADKFDEGPEGPPTPGMLAAAPLVLRRLYPPQALPAADIAQNLRAYAEHVSHAAMADDIEIGGTNAPFEMPPAYAVSDDEIDVRDGLVDDDPVLRLRRLLLGRTVHRHAAELQHIARRLGDADARVLAANELAAAARGDSPIQSFNAAPGAIR